RKVITPEIAPVAPPDTGEATDESDDDMPPPPPPPPTVTTREVVPLKSSTGLFGWGLSTDLSALVLSGDKSLWGIRGNLVFFDPLALGGKIGLAEDAIEYKLGLGYVSASDFYSIPLYADVVVYLREGSLFGLDPYVGAGLINNISGTGSASGGLGGHIYVGVLTNWANDAGRTSISLGHGTYKVADAYSASGIFLAITQPFIL
ncbi:MAG: hypothetical protein KKA31_01355, partial [Candidatus Margulisbacteria bacterium]|nr:hypothetical protein [Candidatus Margulisiibacteriota bacterium]